MWIIKDRIGLEKEKIYSFCSGSFQVLRSFMLTQHFLLEEIRTPHYVLVGGAIQQISFTRSHDYSSKAFVGLPSPGDLPDPSSFQLKISHIKPCKVHPYPKQTDTSHSLSNALTCTHSLIRLHSLNQQCHRRESRTLRSKPLRRPHRERAPARQQSRKPGSTLHSR